MSESFVKHSTFTLKRHDDIANIINKYIQDDEVLREIMEDIRKVMRFDANTKYYDEQKKKSIYEYRARLKAKKNDANKTT